MAAMKLPNWCAEERTLLNGRTCSDHRCGTHHIPDAGGFSTFCASTLRLSHVSPLLFPPHLLLLGSARYHWHYSPACCNSSLQYWSAPPQPLLAYLAGVHRSWYPFLP